MSRVTAALCGILLAASAHAASFSENFDSLPNMLASGWMIVNNSSPVGTTAWFQGNNIATFDAHSGAPDSYAAANFENAAFGGRASVWLITPVVYVSNGATVNFFTRTTTGSPFVNTLEFRFSLGAGADVGGTDTSVGTFASLITISGTGGAGYPDVWTQFGGTFVTAQVLTGRFAFRHVIDDTSVNGDYIGLDSLATTGIDTELVPEPATMATLGAALLVLAAMRRRRA